jgi:putative SOS response-associated peptidase YedK
VCGRFGLFAAPDLLEEFFALAARPVRLAPRYNVTPGQAVAVVREQAGRRTLDALRWGLVPFWAKDPAIGHRLVNARLDSLADKPAFRDAWSRRRCLLPASGFYEWSAASGGKKRPHFISASVDPLLALAGLWERWRTPTGEILETCVIVTTAATTALASVHDRMPLLVPPDAHALWLDPRSSLAEVDALIAATPLLDVRPVGFAVNDPHNDNATLIAPLESPAPFELT